MFRTSKSVAAAVLVSLGAFVATQAASAQFPKKIGPVPNPVPDLSRPVPNVFKPSVPNPLPNLPAPTLPVPNISKPPGLSGINPNDQLNKLKDEAGKIMNRFNDARRDVERRQRELDGYRQLATSGGEQQQKEAYRQLTAAGVLGTNREQVQKGLQDGLTVVIWSKEFDHAEEALFAKALAASVASANPAPALIYIKKFALESKETVMRNLQNAPVEVRKKLAQEFDLLLVAALNKAVRTGKPLAFTLNGVDVRIGLATYNHWVDVRYNWPELVKEREVLGVPVYRIDTTAKHTKIALLNTFEPYIQVRVRARIR